MSCVRLLLVTAACIAATPTVARCQGQGVPPSAQASDISQSETLIPAPGPALDAQWLPQRFPSGYVSSANALQPSVHGQQVTRARDFLQEWHAGHCGPRKARPLGDALLTAMNCQINRGIEESLILYHYDF